MTSKFWAKIEKFKLYEISFITGQCMEEEMRGTLEHICADTKCSAACSWNKWVGALAPGLVTSI